MKPRRGIPAEDDFNPSDEGIEELENSAVRRPLLLPESPDSPVEAPVAEPAAGHPNLGQILPRRAPGAR